MTTPDACVDTFAKLLARNAVRFADRPAMRHKDFGIWHTWTWAQLLDEVRAYAVATTPGWRHAATTPLP